MKHETILNVLLAEDDPDDRNLFERALKEIPITTHLRTVTNGEELMDYLALNTTELPDVLFLDLSMPRKTGYECLLEIKENKKMEALHVVIFTTSITQRIDLEMTLINTLSNMGSQEYLRKPSGFEPLKLAVQDALKRVIQKAQSDDKKHIL
jgi:CheY-like chemotaxis protein